MLNFFAVLKHLTSTSSNFSIFFSACLVVAALTACQTSPPLSSGVTKTQEDRKEPIKTLGQVSTLPKLGFILGPGGFKSFAHLGVLREFEKMGFKVHAIVGLEWGALVGAIYSMRGKSHDLEWQLSKLKSYDLDGGSKSVRTLNKFFSEVFQNNKFESSSVSFSCPSLYLKNGKTAWWNEGLLKTAIEKCIAFPPLFESHQNWMAAAFGIEEAAQKLREMGAESVIFVNVLARGQLLKDRSLPDQTLSELLWWNGVSVMSSAKSGIDWIVGVHTRNYDILDFEARDSFILFGQEFGAAAAKKMFPEF